MWVWIRFVRVSLLVVINVVASIGLISAQTIRKPVRVLTTKDGLPQSFVSGLIQDTTGFIWIGTRNGLARYDGRQFVSFHYKQGDSTTLSSDVIIGMIKDGHGQIWIEHESGELDKLNPQTQRIERTSQRPLMRRYPPHFARRGWTIDALGNLWSTKHFGGVLNYDWARGTLRRYTPQSHGLPSDTVRGVLASRNGSIWLISPNAISQLNPTTGKVRSVSLPVHIQFERLSSPAGGTLQLHERGNGDVMWFYNNQLIVFSPKTRQFRQLPIPFASTNDQCWFHRAPDGQDYLTTANRVYRYDSIQGLVVLGQFDVGHASVASLLVDQSGLVWVGTNAAGIHQIDRSGPYFDSYPNQLGFHQDLLQQELGVSIVKSFDWSATDKDIPGASYSLRSTYDASNRLWLVLHYQIGYYDPTQKRINLLPILPSFSAPSNKHWHMGGIRFDPSGTLWVVDGTGYVAFFDTKHQQWVTWLTESECIQTLGTQAFVVDLFVDANSVWLTTRDHGLIQMNRVTRKPQLINKISSRAHLPTNMLLGLQPDPSRSDRLWIGSYEGLICLEKNTLQSKVFTTADGLPDNTIYSILADDEGYFWLSTNRGLCRFDPRTYQVRTFSTADGLLGDEFNRFHQLRLPDGRLAFGGTEGWTVFDPRNVQNDHFQPPVALTELKINNRLVSLTPGQEPLPVPINELSELTVPYRQNTISVSFTGLEYNQPNRLRYRYQLLGYDDDWVDTGFSPLATYTQLPPGPYTLRVNATNVTGQWSRHIHELKIDVVPPWWLSRWAYLFYAALVVLLLRIYVRMRTNQVREQQERIAQQRDAEQLTALYELKSRFFTNITHELRTPLTLILGPTERLKTEVQEPSWQRWLTTIDNNAHKLLALINQLLDLSRLEAGVISVEEGRGDVGALVSQLVESMRPEAEAKGLQLTFINELGSDQYWFDAHKLERIGLNLLSNAIKFTQNGYVAVTLQPGIRLIVEDTGPGIEPGEQERIFDRFYQTEPASASAQGSGIGLALVKELVSLLQGTISVESQPADPTSVLHSDHSLSGWTQAGWTRFTVELPYRIAPQTNPISSPAPEEYKTPLSVPEAEMVGDDDQLLVLIVEDNAELGDFIAESLPTQYRILRASDGIEGMEAALMQGPDLIISDVLMPRMDGYTLCQNLKQDVRTSHIPIILLTAKVTLSNRMQGLAVGADDYLTKPFHLEELQLRVHNLLERQRRQQAWLRAQLIRSEEPTTMPVDPVRLVNQQPSDPANSPLPKDTVPNNPFLEDLQTLLASHFANSRFGVEEMAETMGLSRVHLYRKVKVLSGLTATELLRNYRLTQATRLLGTGRSVTDTSYAVGFESPAYFAKCFRDLYGLTPTDFQSGKKMPN